MTRLLTRAALAASAALFAPATANAALLRYDVAGTVAGKFTATFTLDTSRAPDIRLSDSIRYFLPITYTLPNSTVPITENAPFDGVTFSAPINQGGLFYGYLDGATNYNNRIQLFGPALFTGPTTAPVFLTGSFDLSDVPPNGAALQPNYRVAVTDLSAAVPEPAAWGLMLLGFAAVGAAVRRRPARVRFAA